MMKINDTRLNLIRADLEKYKKSPYLAIVVDCDCKAVAMSTVHYDPSVKPRKGHVKTDRYTEFDYDQFVKKGYSYTNDGYIVLKDDCKILVTATHAFRPQGFNTFLASIIRNTDMESELDSGGEFADTILDLALHSLTVTSTKLRQMYQEHDGIVRISKFVM